MIDISLRDYQVKGLEKINEAFETCKSVLGVLPTGGGKTKMFIKGLIEPRLGKERIWIVVHTDILIEQTSRELKKAGVPHGVIKSGHPLNRPFEDVQICSKSTLSSRISSGVKYKKPGFIIVDEAHHVAEGNGWGQVLREFSDSKHYMTTATPCRLDGKPLGDFVEKMIVISTPRELVEKGFLKRPRYFIGEVPDISKIRRSWYDYNQKDLYDAFNKNSLIGNMVEEYKKHAYGKTMIGFAINIEDAEKSSEIFNKSGIPSDYIHSKEKSEVSKRIEKLRNKEILVLWNIGMATEGFDLPAIDGCFFRRRTKSLSLYLQMGGRALRPNPDVSVQDNAYIFDHAGNISEHLFLLTERIWSLEGKPLVKNEKKELKKKEKFVSGQEESEISLEEDKEMIEISDEKSVEIEKTLTESQQKFRQLKYREFEDIAYSKGKSPKYIYHLFMRKFKERPTKKDRALSTKKVKWEYDSEEKPYPVWDTP